MRCWIEIIKFLWWSGKIKLIKSNVAWTSYEPILFCWCRQNSIEPKCNQRKMHMKLWTFKPLNYAIGCLMQTWTYTISNFGVINWKMNRYVNEHSTHHKFFNNTLLAVTPTTACLNVAPSSIPDWPSCNDNRTKRMA